MKKMKEFGAVAAITAALIMLSHSLAFSAERPKAGGVAPPTITGLSINGSSGDIIPNIDVKFKITGNGGNCGARIEYGDGQGDSISTLNLSSPPSLTHKYKHTGTYSAVIKGATIGPFGTCGGEGRVTVNVKQPMSAASSESAMTLITSVEMLHAIGTYAAPTTLKANVKKGPNALADTEVSFFVKDKFVGKSKTDGNGAAKMEYTVPDHLADGSEIKAEAAGAAGKNTIGLVKRSTKLILGVYYPGTEAVVEEGKEVTIKGHLVYEGELTGPKNRKIRIVIDGKTQHDDTNDTGGYSIKFKAPMIYKGGDSHTVQTFFDAENECCFLPYTSKVHTIKVKPGPNKFPPPVTNGPAIKATGYY